MRLLKPTYGLLLLAFGGLPLGATQPAWAQCQRAKLTADDGVAGDHFASAVAVSGNEAVVGARGDDDNGSASGSVHVLRRYGSDWTWVGELLGADGAPEDWFGYSVGMSAGAILIGAPYDDDLGTSSGSAYVFERDPNGVWAQTAKLVPDDGAEYELFGYSVALDSDRAIIGARHDDDNGWRSGSAYVFERDPNGVWSQTAKLLADDGRPYHRFGTAVALSGEAVAIGAPEDADMGNYCGSAYVFERDPNGVWSQAAKLLPDDGGPFWSFGECVAVSGNRVLVGATTAHAFGPSAGAAYIYQRDPNGDWPQVAQIVSDDIYNSDFFGVAVALDGDIAVVGAENADYNDTDSGAAYVFVRQADGIWAQAAKIGASDGAFDDRFGTAIGLSGNSAVIGAYRDDDQGEDSGSAYVFAVGPDEDGDGTMDVCQLPGTPTQAAKGHQGLGAGRQSPVSRFLP